jgi:hypothetical protein
VKKIFLVLILFSFLACNRKDVTPEGILPKEKMVSIFIDMHIVESQISSLNLKRDSSRLLFKHYEQKVLEKHNVNDSLYQESYNYYLYNVNDMEKIYDAVIDSLSLRERITKID